MPAPTPMPTPTPGSTANDLPCDVQTVLAARCWSCHGPTPAAGVRSLTNVATMKTTSTLDPSKTVAEMAVLRMQSDTAPMPPAPAVRPPPADVTVIAHWIGAGYPAGTSCGPVCTSGKTWSGKKGPEMNPGKACIDCHSRDEGPRFSIAGTVYPTLHEPDLCIGADGVDGAQVTITGADGRTLTLTPNASGNFYSTATVALPFSAKVVYMGRERAMTATQTSGDCNGCHTQDGATGAPGRIMLP